MKHHAAAHKKHHWGRILPALVLAVILCTAVLPYWFPPRLTEAQQAAFDPEALYGQGPCADRVALVESPAEGLDTRMQLLAEARETLDISYYGIPMGETTDQFLAGVLDAAQRGVQVRILVDGVSGGLTHFHPTYARAMGAHPNIRLKIYNPPCPLAPWTFNGRLHDKYIIADGRLLLLGGRNIGDRYFDPDSYAEPVSFDRDVLVYNTQWQNSSADSAIGQVRRYMDSIWNSSAVKEPFIRDNARSIACRDRLLALADTLPQAQALDWPALTLPAARITLLHNDTHIGPKAPAVGYALEQTLRRAKKSVLLQSPYIVPDAPLEELLRHLGQQQTDYTILTNSLAASPNLPACSSYLTARRRIAATGARLMEYQGPDALHAKTYLVDGRLALVGSYNLDPRSAYIDTELLLAIDSPELTAQLEAALEGYLQNALQVDPQGDYLPGGIAPRPASLPKRMLAGVLGVLLKPFQCLV